MLADMGIVALCSLGDVDGDRIDDLAILTTERLFVVSMAERRRLLSIEPSAEEGDERRTFVGLAAAAVGDVDGDGRTEVAVAGERREVGRIRLWLYSTRDGRALWSTEGYGRLEHALAPAGDLDGDGIPDLLVGNPMASMLTGSVEARSGKDGSSLHRIVGEFRWSRFGCSIAPLGDVDGDGRPDYAVGAPGPGNSGPEQQGPIPFDAVHRFGAVHIVSGRTGERIRIDLGADHFEEDGHDFGSVLASGQDFDQDGTHDLVVGQGYGETVGARKQQVLVLSGKSGGLLLRVDREGSAADGYGRALAVLPDRTRDGVPEILVGAPEWNLGDRVGEEEEFVQDVGAAEIVDGADGSSLALWTGAVTFQRLGRVVARVGDLACTGLAEGVLLVSWKSRTCVGSISLD